MLDFAGKGIADLLRLQQEVIDRTQDHPAGKPVLDLSDQFPIQ
jgi:hypothetical protein